MEKSANGEFVAHENESVEDLHRQILVLKEELDVHREELYLKEEKLLMQSVELEAQVEELCANNKELHSVARSLRKSEEKYRSLFESMNEGVALLRLIYDDQGQPVDFVFLDVNPIYEVIMNAKKEERVGKKASECYGQTAHLEIYGKVASTKEPATFDSYSARLRKHLRVSAFSPEKGKVAVIFSDITERKQTEELSKTLSEISIMMSSHTDYDQTIKRVIAISRKALEAESAEAFVRNSDTGTVRYDYKLSTDKNDPVRSGIDNTLIRLTANDKKPVAVSDMSTDERFRAEWTKKRDTRSFLTLPIILNNEVTEVIVFYYNHTVAGFSRAQIDFVDRLSSLLALSITNSKLYESLQQKLRERKRLEESLQEIALNAQMRAAALETTIASIGEGIIIYNRKGEIIRMNDYACSVFGYTPECFNKPLQDMIKNIEMFRPDGTPLKFRNLPIYRTLQGEVFHNEDYLLKRNFAHPIWISLSAVPLKDETDVRFGAVMTFTDITERKMAEEEHKLDEVRFEALLKLNNMAGVTEDELFNFALESALIITESRIGQISTVDATESRAAIRSVTGGVMNETETDSRNNLKHLDIKRGGLWTEVFRTRQPLIVNDYGVSDTRKSLPKGHLPIDRLLEVPVIDKDRIVALCAVANKEANYSDADTRQLSLLMNDVWQIVSRKRVENELLEAKTQAELYLDLMGHDISNMHQIAIGYLELLKELGERDPNLKEMIDKPLEALNRSSNLIENVRKLQMIKANDINMSAVDLDRILALVTDEYNHCSVIKVTRDGGNKHRRVIANDLLYDVFSNIIGNAVKHSGSDTIAISITVDTIGINANTYHKVGVEDYGPGIPDNMKDKIFNRLQRGETGAKGMGLGLHLVKSLVKSFQGRVWVEDRVPGDYSKGCRFVVMLPAIE